MSAIEPDDGSTRGLIAWPRAPGAPLVLMHHAAIENRRILHRALGGPCGRKA